MGGGLSISPFYFRFLLPFFLGVPYRRGSLFSEWANAFIFSTVRDSRVTAFFLLFFCHSHSRTHSILPSFFCIIIVDTHDADPRNAGDDPTRSGAALPRRARAGLGDMA
jgi:hypothetical protein